MGLLICRSIGVGVQQGSLLPDGAIVDPEDGSFFVDPETGDYIVDPDPQ